MTVWKHHVDVTGTFHSETLTVAEKAAAIAAQIKAAAVYADDDLDLVELVDLVDELADIGERTEVPEAQATADFDDIWSQLYDWADRNQVWLNAVFF